MTRLNVKKLIVTLVLLVLGAVIGATLFPPNFWTAFARGALENQSLSPEERWQRSGRYPSREEAA